VRQCRGQPLVRAVSGEQWEELMQTGAGDWIAFALAAEDGEFLVVERGGRLLAYLQHQPHENRADWYVLNRLETRRGYRRRGHARRLVERACAECGAAVVIARGVRTASRGFWERLGFQPDGFGPEREGGVTYSEGNYVWSPTAHRDSAP
jgi:GNAT superfamily N-acetyltransferase